jgi:ubiquinone/menaquinone biosynthesis C-methylase UbiE
MNAANRYYFDFCDRLALRRLLPEHGERFVDVCGGYGRLAREYLGNFKEAFLFDYAPNLLAQAKVHHGGRLQTVQGTVYEMPFASGEFDALILIRAALHLADLNAAVGEITRILKNGGIAVIEIANKQNIFEIARWLCGRSTLRPFSPEQASRNTVGFYYYHPRYVEQIFHNNGLRVKKTVAVSGLRRHVSSNCKGVPLLCALEYFLQYTIGRVKWSASIFYLLEKCRRAAGNITLGESHENNTEP